MMKECVLTIDVGTSSYRVSLFDLQFMQIAQQSYKIANTHTLDAERCWDIICDMTNNLMASLNDKVNIRGISVSSQVAWLGIDASGNPVAPVLTWMDQSPEEMQALASVITSESVYEKTARRLSAEYGGLKLQKIKKNNPSAYEAIKYFFSLKDYINYKLTGEAAIDRTSACYTLLYNPLSEDWDEDILAALSIPKKILPPLINGYEVLGKTLNDTGMPIPNGIPVAASGPDGTVGVLGAGGYKIGTAVDIMGTTDVFLTCSNRFISDKNQRLIVNPHVIEDLWVVGGPMGLSGGTASWFVHTLMSDLVTYKSVNEQAEKIPPGCDGLLMNPGLTGERAPFWSSEMAGTVFGIGLNHTAAHLFRAIMEGNSYAIRYLCHLCSEAGSPIDQIIAIGGATQHTGWLQIKADITGIPIYLPRVLEATSMGCAVLAWISAGVKLSEQQDCLEQPCKIFDPDKNNEVIYNRFYQRYLYFIKTAADFYKNQKGGDALWQDR